MITFLRFFWVILLFKMASKHSAEVLRSVPNYKKTMMYITEKNHALGKPLSVTSYGVPDREFNVNKSTLYIISCVFKQTHIRQGCVLTSCPQGDQRLAGT